MARIRKLLKALILGLVRRKKPGKKGRFRSGNAKIVDEHSLVTAAGSLGPSYHGRLEDRSEIVVMRLNAVATKPEQEFCDSVNALAQISHKNLLSIRGFCVEGGERMLVHNFMPNGSLLAHLHGNKAAENALTWERRVRIALGAAEGLLHLHRDPPTVHGGLRASNILLDSNFHPTLAESGFQNLLEGDAPLKASCSDYLAPELQESSESTFSTQSDVFSFGLLLLELVSGRKPTATATASDLQPSLLQSARQLHADGEITSLADPKLGQNFCPKELLRLASVAISCSCNDPHDRPEMHEVAKALLLP